MPDEATSDAQIGVYIDFDNILISHYDDVFGSGSYRTDTGWAQRSSAKTKQRLKDARINLGAIIDYASSFGTVAISRAYANWAAPVNASYAKATMARSIDLVQLFPMTGTKNGADIRLAIDVIDDIMRFANITHVMVVAGDSDYVALAQRCKRMGRHVIGVGAGESAQKYWIWACDEFRYYEMLPNIAGAAPTKAEDLAGPQMIPTPVADHVELLKRALTLLCTNADIDLLHPGKLKNQMLRLDPSFDEATLSFKSFTAFLESLPEIVEVVRQEGVTKVRLTTAQERAESTEAAATDVDMSHTGALRNEVADLRTHLGLPRSTGLGADLERACVEAIRVLWSMSVERPMMSALKELTFALVERGHPELVARRAAFQIVRTDLPVLVRTPEMNEQPNPEIADMDDPELTAILRQWIADRARSRLHPDPVRPELIAAAVFGSDPPADAVAEYELALRTPGHDQIVAELAPWRVHPRILWDVCAALITVRADESVDTVDKFASVISPELADRDCEVEPAELSAAYSSLRDSELLRDDVNGTYSRAFGWRDHEVAREVLRTWIDKLRSRQLFDADAFLCREAFFRIALTDKYRQDWRNWVRALW